MGLSQFGARRMPTTDFTVSLNLVRRTASSTATAFLAISSAFASHVVGFVAPVTSKST